MTPHKSAGKRTATNAARSAALEKGSRKASSKAPARAPKKSARSAGKSPDKYGIRDDFVPKDDYLSKEIVLLEKERLWPHVWQVVCRVEEVPQVGDYVVYDVADESIVVMRTDTDTIKAYHNVCQHRGRRLLDGSGHASKFHCRFHGWQWNIDGSILRVLDRHDWEGCPDMGDDTLKLKEVRTENWSGWVYINMDDNAPSLREYLAPVPDFLDPFEFETMRIRWHKSLIFPCNWKIALEAFNEGYHVFGSHPQLLELQGDDATYSKEYGIHAMFGQALSRPMGAPSPRTNLPVPDDLRPGLIAFYKQLNETLGAIFSPRAFEATTRLMNEVSPDMDGGALFVKMQEFHKEAAIATGAGWPRVTLEEQGRAGTAWHVFPNHIYNFMPDALLSYRARPNGDDPDSCVFDVWSLQRYAPGAEPPLKHEFYEDWQTDMVEKFGLILSQDFGNMGEIQKGMKSRGFAGSRTNPHQERPVMNFHRTLHRYLNEK